MEEEKEKPRCEICNKTFSSLDGLEHHNRDKHPETIEKPKKKVEKIMSKKMSKKKCWKKMLKNFFRKKRENSPLTC